ncbi:MAG: prolyl oligopeptidase family serine peptidase [Planctomycetota bacterium]
MVRFSTRAAARFVAGASLLSFISAAASAQDPLTPAEALQLRQVINPVLGDGFAAFQMVVPRPIAEGAGGSRLHVGVLDLAIADGKISAAGEPPPVRWLVDGQQSVSGLKLRPGHREVSFTARVNGASQVIVQSVAADAGKPSVFATTPSVRSYRWRPDGEAVAFTVLDPMPKARADAQERGFRPVIVDEDWRHISLWMCERGGEPRRLTEGCTVYDFQWAPDGGTLACAVADANTVDASYMRKRLYALDVATGERKQLVDNPGKLGEFAFSPDGSRLAYISAADRNDPHAGTLYLADVASGDVEPLSYGFQGMVQHVQAASDGFLVQESVGVRTRLRALDGDGKHLWMFEPKADDLSISGFSSHGSAKSFVFAASHANHPAELFAQADESDAPSVRLTDSNVGLAAHAFGEQRVERIRTRDGVMVEGMLVLPIGYQEGTRYPLVIVAHGGPEAHYSNGWLTTYSQWGHLLAARGIASWYPNYRSSTGYGVAFCKHDHGDPMGKEFTDHLDAIDYFVAKGIVDRDRVGVGGGSYGGYTAAWAATNKSEHFACAVSFVPFVDIRTKWLTTDIPTEFFYVHYQEKWPWEQKGLLEDRSPLTWARNCETPLLVLGGTSDPRVHPSQPFMLYRAVKYATETPVRYVQYDGEGHGNRVNVNRMDYCLRTMRWFEHYLLGSGTASERRTRALPPMDVPYPK